LKLRISKSTLMLSIEIIQGSMKLEEKGKASSGKCTYMTLQYQVLLHHLSNPMQWHSNWVLSNWGDGCRLHDKASHPLGAKFEGLRKTIMNSHSSQLHPPKLASRSVLDNTSTHLGRVYLTGTLYWTIYVITNKTNYHIWNDKRPKTVTRTIITTHEYKPEYDIYVTDVPSQKSQKVHTISIKSLWPVLTVRRYVSCCDSLFDLWHYLKGCRRIFEGPRGVISTSITNSRLSNTSRYHVLWSLRVSLQLMFPLHSFACIAPCCRCSS
jgi:hypothetical protein